ncbi:MAG: RecQ family ATP-dependent DNA helicase [Verrucomicrobiota bacterium]
MEQAEARELLKQMLGAGGAEFREGQWEAIDLVANRRQRLLVVQRTGWGKSVVYFLATKILRNAGAGPTLLVSPLLSLMRNQIAAAEKLGIRALTIHSENIDDWPQAEATLKQNECDVLLVAPERLGNPEFTEKILPLFRGNIGLFVVDEAHCISDWGHDFRPDYRRIVRVLRLLPAHVPVLGTTATANDRVVNDVQVQLPGLHISRGPLIRPSLKLYNIRLDDQTERLAWLAHFLPQLPGSGIIYTLTIQDSERVANWLQQKGVVARSYHADMEAEQRVAAEQALLNNDVKALVATVALGMGFDKPDLGFVVHFQRPGSVVAYYQQVGRAGRAVDTAFGILLNGREDDEIQDYFIRTAFPPLEVMEGVLRALEKTEALTIDEIGA